MFQTVSQKGHEGRHHQTLSLLHASSAPIAVMILMPCCLYAGVHVQAVSQEGHEGHHHKAGANAVQVPAAR